MKRKVFFMHRKSILERFKAQKMEENTDKFNGMRRAKFYIRHQILLEILCKANSNITIIKKQVMMKQRLVRTVLIMQAMFRRKMKAMSYY